MKKEETAKGSKKGIPKVPGSGRKKGTPNKMSVHPLLEPNRTIEVLRVCEFFKIACDQADLSKVEILFVSKFLQGLSI